MARASARVIRILPWVLLLAAALFLFYWNLSGIAAPTSDENRVYRWNPFSPILYFICRPFTHHFQSQDAPYYVMATFAVANFILIARLARSLFSSTVAFWAASFYLLNDMAHCYSRSLYYSTPLVFFVLIAMLAYSRRARGGVWGWAVLAGAMPGIMFYTNPSAYVIIIGCGLWMLYMRIFVSSERGGRLMLDLLVMSLAAVSAYVLIELYSFWQVGYRPDIPYESQWKTLTSYSQLNALDGTGPVYLLSILGRIWRNIFTPNFSQFYRTLLIVLSLISCVWVTIKSRCHPVGAFVMYGLGGGVTILAGVLAGKHGLYMRNIPWILPVLAVAFGYCADRVLRFNRLYVRGIGIAVLAIYFFLSAIKVWAVIHSFFSVNEIDAFLKEHNIPKTSIMTRFQINRYEDFVSGKTTKDVPFVRDTSENDNRRGIYYRIYWPSVDLAFMSGQVRYYLTSSIGHVANVGRSDVLLENTLPIKVWKNHPMNNPHLLFDFEPSVQTYDIRLYDLKDLHQTAVRLAAARRAPKN